jgi:hypothetical protein
MTNRQPKPHGITRVRGRLSLGLVIVLGVIAASTGIVAAFWGGAGAGTGSANAGTALALTISGGSPSSQLYPGGAAGVSVMVSNPNLFPIRLRSLTIDDARGSAGFSVDAGHLGCSTAVLSLADSDNGGAGWTIPAKSGAVDGTLAAELVNAVSMTSSASAACQGATFTVYVKTGT